MVVTYRPHPETKFGEPWYLQTFSAKGDDIWHTRVAHAPLFGTSHGSHLVMAAVDISGGELTWVLCDVNPYRGSCGYLLGQVHAPPGGQP